jgi:hypothetical protein
MWGMAVYFAKNSSYSHGYRYTVGDGTFQMFYARVMVGNFKEMNPDGTLRMPPFIDGS